MEVDVSGRSRTVGILGWTLSLALRIGGSGLMSSRVGVFDRVRSMLRPMADDRHGNGGCPDDRGASGGGRVEALAEDEESLAKPSTTTFASVLCAGESPAMTFEVSDAILDGLSRLKGRCTVSGTVSL